MLNKLVPSISDKEMYVLHYENLQLYLRLGLKRRKNTSCIRTHSQWLKPYVEFNTHKK